MSSRKTVIVAGYLIRNTGGGHVLSILHYLDGLRQLGYDVVFLEHFGWTESCYDPSIGAMTDDPSYGISVISGILQSIGVERWCYVGADGTWHGMSREQVLSACRSAEFLISLWLVTWMEEMRECRYRIFIDLDPGFTQFPMSPTPTPARDGYASPYEFDIHFSYGTRIGAHDCPIPTHGIVWFPLLPPVSLRLLPRLRTTDCGRFTTVMGWNSRKPIVFDNQEYGQKDIEFQKVIDLPRLLPDIRFEIALGGGSAPREQIAAAGWTLVDPQIEIPTPERYMEYIAGSGGEFSVAVNLEVKARSGWFSDRTAAYLASGKPAVVQDTGFSEILPCGEGLFAFDTIDDAVAAIETLCADYPAHCRAARALAEQHLDARHVLRQMLRQCGIMPDVSIVINNYNYGRFLPFAIDSALEQIGADVEVIVVDDGSTDDSREVMARYGSRIRSVLKENGGQASALNAGFEASSSDVVIFLDADDMLAPTAAAHALRCFDDPDVVKVHWHLRKIDAAGDPTGDLWPRGDLPRGNLRDALVLHGPTAAVSAPTSGNAWARRFLEKVMPIAGRFRLCADEYLYTLAPAFGTIERIDDPQSYYRFHGENNFQGRRLESQIEFGVRVQTEQCDLLAEILASQGVNGDRDAWLRECWFHRLKRVSDAIESVVDEGMTMILVDDDLLGAAGSIAGRRYLPMTESEGRYWGPPADNAAAFEELRRLAGQGGSYVAIVWSSFWWLESYPILRRLLESDGAAVVTDDVVIFRIDGESIDSEHNALSGG